VRALVLCDKLSFRDFAEMMAERGLSLAHTMIMHWVRRFTSEFVKRWNRLAMTAGQSWRVEETYGTPSQSRPFRDYTRKAYATREVPWRGQG
jgi:hypothetical protein